MPHDPMRLLVPVPEGGLSLRSRRRLLVYLQAGYSIHFIPIAQLHEDQEFTFVYDEYTPELDAKLIALQVSRGIVSPESLKDLL